MTARARAPQSRRVARPKPLSPEELAEALAELPRWSLRDGKLHCELAFADFVGAFAFMSAMA